MKVLAIETSCDETGVAVVEGDGRGPVRIIANSVYSQIALHRRFGGVYPEAASREHVKKIGLVLEAALQDASQFSGKQKPETRNPKQIRNSKTQTRIANCQLPTASNLRAYVAKEIDFIAVTAGPGLIGSLLVGVNTAKSLAYAFDKPLIAVNHHEGHIAAAWLEPSGENSKSETPNPKQIQNLQLKSSLNPRFKPKDSSPIPKLPALALVVSGGHTMLVLMKAVGDYAVLGRTRDDAAGEAFDKTARLLDLPYPGGPEISRMAATYEISRFKDIKISRLPRPMIDSGDLSFSFSGLKTAAARWVALNQPLTEEKKRALAHEVQEAIVDVLVAKTVQAIKTYHPNSVILTGGVAANGRLRNRLTNAVSELPTTNCQLPVFIPPSMLCTDNAAMIGAAGLLKSLAGQVGNWYDVTADDSLSLVSAEVRSNK